MLIKDYVKKYFNRLDEVVEVDLGDHIITSTINQLSKVDHFNYEVIKVINVNGFKRFITKKV